MTKTERMKLAIQQRQVALMNGEAEPVKQPPIKNVDAQTDGAADMAAQWADEVSAAAKKKKQPKPAKKPQHAPQPDGAEKFDTALQLHDRSRLPDGAEFKMRWKDGQWFGILTIHHPPMPDMTVFTLSGRKLFRLLADIDGLYREWKRQNASPEADQTDLGASDDRSLGSDNPLYRKGT